MNPENSSLNVVIIDENQSQGFLIAKALDGHQVGNIRLSVSNYRNIAELKSEYPLVILILPHVDDFLTRSVYLTSLTQAQASAVLLLAPKGNTNLSFRLPAELVKHISTMSQPVPDSDKVVKEICNLYKRCQGQKVSWTREAFFPMDLLQEYYHDVIDKEKKSFFPDNPEEAEYQLGRIKSWLNGSKERFMIDISHEEIKTLKKEEADALLWRLASMELLQSYRDAISNETPFFPESHKEAEECLNWVKSWLLVQKHLEGQNNIKIALSPEEIRKLTIQQANEQLESLLPADELAYSPSEYKASPSESPTVLIEPSTHTATKRSPDITRILVIDDDWDQENFWPRYVVWDTENKWEFIFADFSLKCFTIRRGYERIKENPNLIDILFFTDDQFSAEEFEESWRQLVKEKCFVVLLDNFYGNTTKRLELGQLFLSACTGSNPEDNNVWQHVQNYCETASDEKERREIQEALKTIRKVYQRVQKGEKFLPKVILHSQKEEHYDQFGNFFLPKSVLRTDAVKTNIMLNAFYHMGLAELEEICHKKGLKSQHIAAYGDIIGISKEIRDVYKQIDMAKDARDVTVLIRGESGTGKEVIAREIAKGRFLNYLRRLKPELNYDSLDKLHRIEGEEKKQDIESFLGCYFKAVNIGAITTEGNLLQVELFGCSKDYPNKGDEAVPSIFEFVPPDDVGGDSASHRKKVAEYVAKTFGFAETPKEIEELANEVVVFLDEIGEAPLDVQIGLLRALQEHEITPLPTSRGQRIKVQFKLISATNADLEKKIQNGEFREDFYYRISDIEINLPRLADRPEDIPLLIKHFIEKWVKRFSEDFWFASGAEAENSRKQFHWEDYSLLLDYSWPGNVRELEQTVKQSLLYTYYENNRNADFMTIKLYEHKKDAIKRHLADKTNHDSCPQEK